MIKNYLTIAWRNLLKHKSFSLINILGLSIGMATCIIIFTYVRNELTYDQYNPHAERIARVSITLKTPESDMAFATSPYPLADVLTREFPEVEHAVRLEPIAAVIKSNNELFKQDGFCLADQSLFTIFPFSFVEGSASTALQHPDCIVLTETMARKYFPQGAAHPQDAVHPKDPADSKHARPSRDSGSPISALGRRMTCNGKELLVTGIVKDRPNNSDIRINALVSTDFSKFNTWMGEDFSVYTFILLKDKSALKGFEKKLLPLAAKGVQQELDEAGAKNYHARFVVEALKDVHFSQGKLVDTPKGNRQFNYIFSVLAVFILVIALLNYINLSTARATERAKEVGIRKVSGAVQFQLIRQFLFESFVLICFACLLAIGFAALSLPFFNKIFQTSLSLTWAGSFWFMAAICVATILFAGLYPAFVLSRFRPAVVLKGSWRNSVKGIALRKTVTIIQFVIAAALITGTTIIDQQMKFIRNKDLGFSKDQVMNIYTPIDSAARPDVGSFYQALKQRPEINGVTAGSGLQQEGIPMATTIVQTEGKKREFMSNYYFIDPQFLPFMKIQMLEGRNLTDSFSTDKNEGILVNEAFVQSMGWTSGLGKNVEGFGKKGKVIGVVKNFYYKSLHNMVEPLVLVYNSFPVSTIMVRTKPEHLPIIKSLWQKQFPGIPFEYSFLDDVLNQQYQQDQITMNLFNDFTILAIFVSCLGLYGLVSLITVQRSKEMGIRKVLGAHPRQLFSLLTNDFLKLVAWSLLIALPLAGLAMNKWLSGYAYHVDMKWWFFIIPLLSLPIIAIAVISREVIRAAMTNPVNSLRAE